MTSPATAVSTFQHASFTCRSNCSPLDVFPNPPIKTRQSQSHACLSRFCQHPRKGMLYFQARLSQLSPQKRLIWCVVDASSGVATWLDHVHGCACCLTRTSGVTPCYMAAKGCGSSELLSDCCHEQDERGREPKVGLRYTGHPAGITESDCHLLQLMLRKQLAC